MHEQIKHNMLHFRAGKIHTSARHRECLVLQDEYKFFILPMSIIYYHFTVAFGTFGDTGRVTVFRIFQPCHLLNI